MSLYCHLPFKRTSFEAINTVLVFFYAFSSLLFSELCLKESLCMGISSKLLLDAAGTQGSELDSIYSLDRGRLEKKCICNTNSVCVGCCRSKKNWGEKHLHQRFELLHFLIGKSFKITLHLVINWP